MTELAPLDTGHGPVISGVNCHFRSNMYTERDNYCHIPLDGEGIHGIKQTTGRTYTLTLVMILEVSIHRHLSFVMILLVESIHRHFSCYYW